MKRRRNSGAKTDRSDSGPVGLQLRNVLGLDDSESLDEVLEPTKLAIANEGLRDLVRVDRGGYGVVCRAVDVSTGNLRAIKVVLQPDDEDHMAFGKTSKEWPQVFRDAGVSMDVASILLPKMETPPEKIAMHSMAKEF